MAKDTGALLRIGLKALALFIVFNVLYYAVQPLNLLNRLTVYNTFVPGRLRLAFGEYPDDSYNISIVNLDQMLASHEIARPKAPDEYRVVMIGDSSVWGYLLNPTQTQAACMDRLNLTLPPGHQMRIYNLGYPKLSVVKDLLILRHALRYQPDLIVWSTSLASLYPSDQLDFPIITAQYNELAALQEQYQFKLYQWPLPAPRWMDRTFFGQRRELANWLRYQLYGLGWTATGIDHAVPRFVTPHPVNLAPDDQLVLAEPMLMHLSADHKILPEDLSFDVVKAGIDTAAAQAIPVLLVNEPIYRGSSDLRWNYYYPKWAYDSYRAAIQDVATRENWHYVDFWDAVPADQFTDTDFHLTPAASCAFAEKLSEPILALANAPR
jgi:hypothetical protein